MTRRLASWLARISRVPTQAVVRYALVAVTLGWTGATFAQQDQSAAHLARGVALRKQGQDAAALQEFERAYALVPSPRARAQIALAQQALGAWLEAEQGLLEALRTPEDAWIQQSRPYLDQALTTVQAHLANLWIEVNVVGAELRADGKRVGSAPLTAALRVPAGEVVVEAEAPGYAALRQPLALGGGETKTVQLTLQATAPATRTPASTGPVATSPASADSPRAWQTPAPYDAEAPSSALHTAGVITAIGGGVLLSGALAAYLVREYHATRYNDPMFCSAEYDCADYARVVKTAQTLAITGAVLGSAALATGLVLVLAAPSTPAYAHNFRAYLGPGAAHLAYTARF